LSEEREGMHADMEIEHLGTLQRLKTMDKHEKAWKECSSNSSDIEINAPIENRPVTRANAEREHLDRTIHIHTSARAVFVSTRKTPKREMLPTPISTPEISCLLSVLRKNRVSTGPLAPSHTLQGIGQDHWAEVKMMLIEAIRIKNGYEYR
jgi:hypothetical protein